MRTFSPLVLVALILALGACKPKDVEVSSVARSQAAALVAEAQTQNLLRDYAGAEKALARAVELDPEVSMYWSNLGVNRVMLGDKSGAKKAYKRELELCEKAAKKDPKNIDLQLGQLRPLVLLGRADDARKLLEKLGRENPDNFGLKQLIESKPIDGMIANSKIKDAILK
ncbi:tetratricopeptide repeat protein [Nibricoccus aquaticus]|nr:tetratricopeptide repeat protein [Nibricoccus aquaticus]